LTPAGRLRLVEHCRVRPIAHVAVEAGVSRQCLSKWVGRYRVHDEAGLVDRSSAPHRHRGQLDPRVIAEVERLRRAHKWSAMLITAHHRYGTSRLCVAAYGR
jgi:transposase-like protein